MTQFSQFSVISCSLNSKDFTQYYHRHPQSLFFPYSKRQCDFHKQQRANFISFFIFLGDGKTKDYVEIGSKYFMS